MSNNRQNGFITVIVLIIIGLVIAQNIFHIDVVGFFGSSIFGSFLIQVKQIILSFWAAVSKALSS